MIAKERKRMHVPWEQAILCEHRVHESVPRSTWKQAIDGSISGMKTGNIKYAQVLRMKHSDSDQGHVKNKNSLNHRRIPACTTL